MNLYLAHADTLSVAPDVEINWLAIILATAVAMGIGSVWYGPLFGGKWMREVKLKKSDAQKNWQKPMFVMSVLAFIQAYILSHFVIYSSYFYPDVSGVAIGAITGFWAWAGFSAFVAISNNMFARRSNELIKIEAGNSLVTLLAIGAIIGAWL